ncbi:MAG: hypothetical protein V2A73_17455 [Pseudomonadota bacterium]
MPVGDGIAKRMPRRRIAQLPDARDYRQHVLAGLVAPVALVTACTFDTSGLSPSMVDGPDPFDAPLVDAALDAAGQPDSQVVPDGNATPDAQPSPDGATGPCETQAVQLPLDARFVSGTTSGAAFAYNPSCTSRPSGTEVIYRVDIPAGTGRDLVVEVEPSSRLDAIVDVITACSDSRTTLGCYDYGASGRPEVAVVSDPSPGTFFVVVDGFNYSTGSYRIRAWLRAHAQPGSRCAPDLQEDRCLGSYCLDSDGNGQPECTSLTPQLDGSDNDDVCTTASGPYTADFVVEGTTQARADIDVIKVVPAQDSRMLAVVYGPAGSCPTDVTLGLLSGDCAAPTTVAIDDQSGLGSCPMLVEDPVEKPGALSLEAGTTYWLRVAGATSNVRGPYTLVIDLRPPTD